MGCLQVAYLNLAPSGAHLYPIRISGNLKIQASFNFDEKISLIEGCQGPKLMPPYRSSTIPLPDPPKPFCHQITLRVLFWDMSNLSLLDFASRALLARPWFRPGTHHSGKKLSLARITTRHRSGVTAKNLTAPIPDDADSASKT